MSEQYKLGEIMLSSEDIQKRIKELGEQISKDYGDEPVLAICVLKGAFIFMSDLIRAIDCDVSVDFMAVSSYGDSTKSSGVVRIIKDLDTTIEGKNVLLVEDIIDTGVTLKFLKDSYLSARHPKSIKICTLLDKPARRRVDVAIDYIGFSVEDQFIVGYGLDYQQRYRNLPHITYMEAK